MWSKIINGINITSSLFKRGALQHMARMILATISPQTQIKAEEIISGYLGKLRKSGCSKIPGFTEQ
jgi:hypothetical protein